MGANLGPEDEDVFEAVDVKRRVMPTTIASMDMVGVSPMKAPTFNRDTSITDEQKAIAEQNAKESGGGLRYNFGKLKFNLIPPEWEQGLAHLLTVGSWKYSDRNWENGLGWDETIAALKRHLNKWLSGENYDQETGSHHLIATAWNALVLFSMQIRGKGKDNVPRPKYVMDLYVEGTMKDPSKTS